MEVQATSLYPFVPSGPDFALARDFFVELGFACEWQDGGLAGLRFGGAYFLLQDIDVPEWQKNQMLVFELGDLDRYWREVESKDLVLRFPTVGLKAPTDYAWGRELHIIDPAGVCWHVRQARA